MSLSTHVLDTASGMPAPGVPVALEAFDGSTLARGSTDTDGRLRLWDGDLPTGTHRLVFETGGDFFPEVTVVFRVTEPGRHLHIPLLLSPYGYTTYRGS